MTTDPTAPGCATCAEAGRKGACARLRCYCGHETCWAFASWVPLRPHRSAPTATTNNARMRDSWNARKEPTWIDKL